MKYRTVFFSLIYVIAVVLGLGFHVAHAQENGAGFGAIPSPSSDNDSGQEPQQAQQPPQTNQQPEQSPQQTQQSQSPPQPLGYGSPRPVTKTKPPE